MQRKRYTIHIIATHINTKMIIKVGRENSTKGRYNGLEKIRAKKLYRNG